MVRSYVQTMGGTIEAESKVGEGSTFTVSLPIKYPMNGSFMEQEVTVCGPPENEGSRGCILLVEDNSLDRDMEAELLKNMGYRVETACDGVSAYELLKESEPEDTPWF